MATVPLTAESFQHTIDDNEIVLIDFWAEWCGPCRVFGPIYDEASERHPDVVFAKVDTEAEQQLAGAFGIRSIPTLAAIRDNVLVFAQPGVVPGDALDDLVTQVRALDMDDVRAELAAGG